MAYILNKVPLLCRSVFRKNIISGPINKNTLVKNYEHFTNRTSRWAERKYKLKDNISDGYRLVYREHPTRIFTIFATYHLGWIGFASSIFCAGYLIYMKPPVREKGIEGILEDEVLRPLSALERILALLTSFTMSIILIVCSKIIPFRIYHNSTEKIYKGVFVNRILGKKQIETFGEGTAVPVFSCKSLRNLLFNINGRIVILDEESFPVQCVRERMIHKTE